MITIHGTPKELEKVRWALASAVVGLERYEEQRGSKTLGPIKEVLKEVANSATKGLEELEDIKSSFGLTELE